MDVRDALVDTRLIEIGDEHGDLELAHEEEGELARHEPGADDADLADLLREALVRCADGTLRALLHQVERVHRRGELVAADELCEGLVLAGEALFARAALGAVEEVEGDVRG